MPLAITARAQQAGFLIDHTNRFISVEPYAANVVRITLSTQK